jgi:ATP-dependent RNA helicase CshB
LNLTELTPIQRQSLPTVLEKKSAIITSQTGTGKTLCYLLPILNDINFEIKKIQTIIVLPTKELARQIYSKVLIFKNQQPNLKCALLIGNTDINLQQQQLRSNPPHIVVGTVTRILDLLKNKCINRDIDKIVLDEVDMLLDLGFFSQINNIFTLTNTYTLQKIACSATIHNSFANQLKKYFTNAKIFNTSSSLWSNANIKNHLVYSSNLNNPMDTLLGLLKNINPYFCIIFANTKNIVNEIYERLLNNGNNVTMLHKDLTTRQRKNIYQNLQNHNFQYLVATDLASRGLDIEGADVVISYGLPEDDIWYMHRIGRTGRANTNGDAYVIYNTGVDNRVNRLTNKSIK